ncbi:hypothetical protein SEA_PIONEER_80 [Mycobacterium phage Pioneer]|uniref:hypothetical protein n=1 Tax=Mycobacterium phage Pioneer TaxID=1698417 RepID=UPI0006BDEC4C|nr:hypothetical protein AVV05_gp029 [Mycobacterium phage Pioneer]ALA07891.1 hypothetical protein SEA_PIONEER_80 [Mycobacterium phage Pioneer]AVI04168.1 hypothetical protein SEA_PHONNEGUT_80 [Mycobacterium phage Phonnegut]QGJ88730.1 hypothetical protein SEA_BEEMO_80 [Mycobacterium phage Beemo]
MREITVTVIETVCTVYKTEVEDDFDITSTEDLEDMYCTEGFEPHQVTSVEVTSREIEAE